MTTPATEPSGALLDLLNEWRDRNTNSSLESSPVQLVMGLLGRGRRHSRSGRAFEARTLADHLVQAHRSEIAQLLIEAASLSMHTETEAGRHVLAWSLPNREVVLTDKRDIHSRLDVEWLEANKRGALDSDTSIRALNLLREPRGGTASAVSMAQQALALEPSSRARGMLGMAQILAGQFASGRSTLSFMLHGTTSDAQHCIARDNSALAEWRLGNLEAAMEHSVQATQWSDAPVSARFNRLFYAIRSIDGSSLDSAAELLSDCCDCSHPSIKEGVEASRWVQAAGIRPYSEEAVSFALSQSDHLPDVARMVIMQSIAPNEEGQQ